MCVCACLVEADSVDVVEEMREQLYGERGVDAAAAQQHHGGGQRLQRGRRGLRGVAQRWARQRAQRAGQLLLEARHQVAADITSFVFSFTSLTVLDST